LPQEEAFYYNKKNLVRVNTKMNLASHWFLMMKYCLTISTW